MIVCPNCTHQNPDGAVQCEACYTPLPATTSCPNCGATVQADASFCGQCGYNLSVVAPIPPDAPAAVSPHPSSTLQPESSQPKSSQPEALQAEVLQPEAIPALLPLDPLVPPDPLVVTPSSSPIFNAPEVAELTPDPIPATPPLAPVPGQPMVSEARVAAPVGQSGSSTQLQQQTARLLHLQTSASLELPQNLSVVHIGKPNDRIPPDIDVSGFPDSEIVSRIHADIRIEGDAFYVEDVGSSNGTYINNVPLPLGNRHRLRPGDRISLGKGDKVTFLFQLS